MEKVSKSTQSNKTAEKLLVVLEALALRGQPVRLRDLAQELEMNSSTLYRFLTVLQRAGYVMQDSDSERYTLTFKICQLAETVKRRFSIVPMVHTYVIEASNLFNESAHLAQREDNNIVYVDNVASSTQMLTIRQHIGKTAPMHCTGIGKLLLLEYSDAEFDQLIAQVGLARYTNHTLTTKGALRQELDTVRSRGYAYDNEECEIGVRCIAVPVRNYLGKIVAGISVSGPTTRLTDQVIEDNLPYLLDIASRASQCLGYDANLR